MEHVAREEFAASLVRVVALHDPETASHLRATAKLARRIAETLLVSKHAVETIELAALVHDIGKVRVRREVLCKRGELDGTEWSEMRLHPQTGADVLAATPVLAHLAPIVRAHHERLDGNGYPDGLRGTDIPLEARVVAIADAFHALTTDRPYRNAMPPAAALHVLDESAGTQFDADVVEAMHDLCVIERRSRRLSA